MHRCFLVLVIANFAIGLVGGCSAAKPAADEARIEVSPVSTSQPPGPELIHGTATVTGTSDAEVPFTLVLPPGWKWADGHAEKSIGPPLTVLISVTARELPDDLKRERSAVAAQRRLLEMGDEHKSDAFAAEEKTVVRDRRIIRIDDTNAAWDVVVFHAEGEGEPVRLETRCHLKLGDKEFTIDGNYIDSREDRAAADFEEAQAEFLNITQSFRLERTDASPRL